MFKTEEYRQESSLFTCYPQNKSPKNPESNPYQTLKSYDNIKHLGHAQCGCLKILSRPVCELSLGKPSGTGGES